MSKNINTISEQDIKQKLQTTGQTGSIIKETVAQNLVEYGQNHGPLLKPNHLLCVEGFGTKISKDFEELFPVPLINLPPHARNIVDECQKCIPPSDNCCKIIHLNLNGLEGKLEELEEIATENNSSIVCVSEINNPDPAKCKINDYEEPFLQKQRAGSESGGVAIYVKHEFKAEKVEGLKTLQSEFAKANAETVWVQITRGELFL